MREVKGLVVKGTLAHYVIYEDGKEVRQVDRDVSAEQAEARQHHESLQNVLERHENAEISDANDDTLALEVGRLSAAVRPLAQMQETLARLESNQQAILEGHQKDITGLTARLAKVMEHAEDLAAHEKPDDVQPLIHSLRQEIMEMRGLLSRLSMDVATVTERATSHSHSYAGLNHHHAEFEEIATLKEQQGINAENIKTIAQGYSTLNERLRKAESHDHDDRYALESHPHPGLAKEGHEHKEAPHVHEATTRKQDGIYCHCGYKMEELTPRRRRGR